MKIANPVAAIAVIAGLGTAVGSGGIGLLSSPVGAAPISPISAPLTVTASGTNSVVPNGICRVTMTVDGGSGGSEIDGENYYGGVGARIVATYRVSPGETIAYSESGGSGQNRWCHGCDRRRGRWCGRG